MRPHSDLDVSQFTVHSHAVPLAWLTILVVSLPMLKHNYDHDHYYPKAIWLVGGHWSMISVKKVWD